jgi:hypothetical protein
MAPVCDEDEQGLEAAKLRPTLSHDEKGAAPISDTHTAACRFPACPPACHRRRWLAGSCLLQPEVVAGGSRLLCPKITVTGPRLLRPELAVPGRRARSTPPLSPS